MQRYFVEKKENNQFWLSADDSYHVIKVMRMKIHEKIEIVYQEQLYICEITTLTNPIAAKIIEKQEETNELNYSITIAQSLVKEQKLDYILQKSTELGVDRIILYQAERSIIKMNQKENKKIERYQKIVKEASEQSKRIKIPEITKVYSLTDFIQLTDFDKKILCTVNEKSQNVKKVLSNINSSDKILFVVGPEGGFTDSEEETFMKNGFLPVSLGNTVLRTETVSSFIMSVIRYLDMR